MMTINYGGYLISLPINNPTLRNDVRRTYRYWRETGDRYNARMMAERTALWYTATSHPQVKHGRNAKCPH